MAVIEQDLIRVSSGTLLGISATAAERLQAMMREKISWAMGCVSSSPAAAVPAYNMA